MSEIEPVVLASGNLQHLRDLARLLSDHGVPAELVRPPEGRGSS